MALILAKWRRGLDSSLDSTDITNGNIYLSTDSGRLHIDIDDERVEVTDFVKETESEILSTLTPLPKFYYATDTYRLWYYDPDNGWCTCSSGTADKLTVVEDDTEQANLIAYKPDGTAIYDSHVYLGETAGSVYLTTINDYVLAEACSKDVEDRHTATAISPDGTNLVTERTVYDGLPKFNGAHDYTCDDDLYTVVGAGTAGQFITADENGVPVWSDPDELTVESAEKDGEGNVISDTYATKEYVDTITSFEMEVVDELPDVGEKGIIYLVPHSHGSDDYYDEYVWVTATSSYEKIGNTDINLENYVTLTGEQALSNKTYEGYTLGDACAREVVDASQPRVLAYDGEGLVTERAVHFGTPTVNDTKDIDSDTKIYSPTAAGNSGQVLASTGSSVVPEWIDQSEIAAGSAEKDANGNVINEYYISTEEADEHISDAVKEAVEDIEQELGDDYVTLDGEQALTNKTYNGYTLNNASEYDVTDAESATAVSNEDANLITARAVYYGTPSVNGSHDYTSDTDVYAPTEAGTENQILASTGDTPAWIDQADITAGKATADANGNVFNEYYISSEEADAHINEAVQDAVDNIEQELGDDYVTLDGEQALTNKTYNGYTLNKASEYNVTDSTIAAALDQSDQNLVTARAVYHGMPTINNNHAYSDDTDIYAAYEAGTSGQVLMSTGGNAPEWKDQSTIAAGSAETDASGNKFEDYYASTTYVETTVTESMDADLPYVNDTHDYTSESTFYAAESAGTEGQILASTGAAPEWIDQSDITAGKATADANGNVFNEYYISSEEAEEKIESAVEDAVSDIEQTLGDDYVTLDGEQAITNKTYNGYTLNNAVEYDVTDAEKATAISDEDENLITARAVYYGTPTINDDHTYTSNTKIYTVTTAGEDGQFLTADSSGMPSWSYPEELSVENAENAEKATSDSEGNVINEYYASLDYVNDTISGIVQFDAEVVDELPAEGEKGIIYLIAHTHDDPDDGYDEYLWITSTSSYEKIGNTDINLENYVTLDGSQDLTNKTYNGYALAAACAYDVTDNSEATAIIRTDQNLITGRSFYYATPMINGVHNYTSDSNIYGAETVGSEGQFMVSSGTGAPIWKDPEELTVENAESAVTDSEGNVINETYVSNETLNITLGDYVSLDAEQNLTNKTYEGYTLAEACSYEVTDNDHATAISSDDHNLVTGETVYYTLPMFNDSHDYTSDTDYFVAEEPGEQGQILEATGDTPTWINQSEIAAGSAITDSEGNVFNEYYASTDSVTELVEETVNEAVQNIEATLGEDYVTLNGEQALTNKTYEGYTLNNAVEYDVTDNSKATAVSSSDQNLITARSVYYGTPQVNGAHNYTSSDDVYAPTTAGSDGQILSSTGSGAPSWIAQSDIAAGSATYDSNGNEIANYYISVTEAEQKIADATTDTDEKVESILEDYVTLNGEQDITNKTYNGYTLGTACAKGYIDSALARTILSDGEEFLTERAIYFGLPTINGAHDYNSNTTIYAPVGGGTSGYVLASTGATGTPDWMAQNDIAAGSAIYDAAGNNISATYATNTYVDNTVEAAVSDLESDFADLKSDIDNADYVTADGKYALTNKTYEGYTLAAACAYDVTDATAATAIASTDDNLITARAVYYGLPTINNSHTYTSNTTIYAPTDGGTADYLLTSIGSTGTPVWTDPSSITVGKATADANGNDIADTYATQETVDDMIGDITGFDAEVVDELPSSGEKGVIYLVPHSHEGDDDSYDEYLWIESSSTWEKVGNTDIDLDNYVTLDGSQALTNKTYEGYTLASACAVDYTDRTTATAISATGTTILSERAIYYGLPTINGAHDYTSDTEIYAPNEAGSNGYILQSNGSGAPSWVDASTVTAGHIDVDVTNDTTSTVELSHGDSFEVVDSITRDEYGHVTSINTTTATLPTSSGGSGSGVGCYAVSSDTTTAIKNADFDGFSLDAGAFAAITFETEVTKGATLNISSTGAKEIYHMGSPIKDDVIQAGATAMFVYTGTYYYLLSCDTEAGGDYIEEAATTTSLASGESINLAMKTLANSLSNITEFKHYDGTPDLDNLDYQIVSAEDSEYPIYMWFADGVIYWWTEAEEVDLNSNMAETFYMCASLTTVDELADWDVSKVTNMIHMFYDCKSMDDFSDLNDWDVDHDVVENSGMFEDSGAYDKYESDGDSSGYPDWYKTSVEFKDDDT